MPIVCLECTVYRYRIQSALFRTSGKETVTWFAREEVMPSRGLVVFARQRLGPWGSGTLGFIWFYWYIGYFALNPTHLDWILTHADGAQHVLGWLFFRHEPWRFPLGSLPSFIYPVGTAVAFTDSMPWVAVIAKILSPLLPVDFQYIGPWLGLCFFLQGYFGAKIVQEFSPLTLIQVMGGTFFIFDPVLISRIGHDSLSAHWLILVLIWLHLRSCPDIRVGNRLLKVALGACIFSAGIHPYLATMVLALSLALLWKLRWADHLLLLHQLVGWGAAFGLVIVCVFAMFGYIGTDTPLGAHGFGFYSADLLTLINPSGGSYLLPTFPTGQWEGYGYLGGGVLILSLVGVVVIARHPRSLRDQLKIRWVPLGICCLLLAAYALSSKVTIAGKPILDLDLLYHPLVAVIEPFRASGRFIWPLHYVLITGVIAIWVRQSEHSQPLFSLLLAGGIALQLMDAYASSLVIREYLEHFRKDVPKQLQVEEWKYAAGLYERMDLYPPQFWGGKDGGCAAPEYTENYVIPLMYYAYRLSLSFNSGYAARLDGGKARRYCDDLDREIKAGEIQNNTIYVVHSAHVNIFNTSVPNITCGHLSGYIVCVSSQRHNAFREVLERHKIE
jgi:hypothetical protein